MTGEAKTRRHWQFEQAFKRPADEDRWYAKWLDARGLTHTPECRAEFDGQRKAALQKFLEEKVREGKMSYDPATGILKKLHN